MPTAICPECEQPFDGRLCKCGFQAPTAKTRRKPKASTDDDHRHGVRCQVDGCLLAAVMQVRTKGGLVNVCRPHAEQQWAAEAKADAADMRERQAPMSSAGYGVTAGLQWAVDVLERAKQPDNGLPTYAIELARAALGEAATR